MQLISILTVKRSMHHDAISQSGQGMLAQRLLAPALRRSVGVRPDLSLF